MKIRNILVAFNGSASAESALRYAASLARGGGIRVTALLAHSEHETVDSHAAWVPARARQIIAEANAEIINAVRSKFDALKAELELGDRLRFVEASGRVDMVIAETARGFDILILGRPKPGDADSHVTLHPDRIALMSGRPIVVVPQGYDREASHAEAAIAWDGSRAAGRALYDSLQLLEDEGRVTLLTVEGTRLPRPVEEVLDHLALHEVEARHEELALHHGVGRTLLAFTRERNPGFLVMGAYEHSKFREDFLGGVTARVLNEIDIPVLLSH
ncbi:universal stress protein [Tropicimonas sediminicola]|uniref:Universal stress protein family protein n=1 Tax=Tropicimonas sediminicola TaxID=1031541 RepID=A0A239LMZ4_9RHOB|nr:universal stress protein [Tropicimonas sediminicola]SNT30964.1 Universal stress protein family protein [Tropicimonas sediminicola]